MVSLTHDLSYAGMVAGLQMQEQRRVESLRAEAFVRDHVNLYARNLKALAGIPTMDRSGAKQKVSEPFGRWVAALDVHWAMKADPRGVAEEWEKLYEDIYKILLPQGHWYKLGMSRDPWLRAPYDDTYGTKVHVFRVARSRRTENWRLILNAKEATPAFVKGYNAVYDHLMKVPTVASAAPKLTRLEVG